MASAKDIKAARKVLYDPERRHDLAAELNSIVILMNFDPGEAIPPDDQRVEPGAGPVWFVPATGEVDPAVLEAADRCEKVAAILKKTRQELGDLEIDQDDKQHLRAAFKHQIQAWNARAQLWRAPGAPDEQLSGKILEHEKSSLQELKAVKEYLKGSS